MNKGKAYGILSDMIFRGFLTTNIRFCDHDFVFKTINEREYDLIQICVGNVNRVEYTNRFNKYFLAYSLLMLDGNNVLINRGENTDKLLELFSEIPNSAFRLFIEHINIIRDQLQDAIQYLEGMCYTDWSRVKWKVLNNASPTEEYFSGVSGTSKAGINVCQEQWIIINRMLDSEEHHNNNFSLALMVASASNTKGAKQIRSQHDSSVKQATEKRKKLAENGTKEVQLWTPEGWAAPVDTTEGLLAELDRQMHGIKDKHDLFIEEHLRKIREAAEGRAKEAADKIQKIREQRQDKGISLSGEQRALTPEESRQLMVKKNHTIINVTSEEFVSNDDQKKFLKKLGSTIITGKR